MLSLDTTKACRHGGSDDCMDCCVLSMERLTRQLGDEDAIHVMDPDLFARLKTMMTVLRRRLHKFQQHEGSDASSVFFSPRAEPPPAKRFQPLIVHVPAFSDRPSVSATQPTQATQAYRSTPPPQASRSTPPPQTYHQARSTPPPRTYQDVRATHHEPVVIIPMPVVNGRSYWTPDETETLRVAYDRYPAQWENMRTAFPALRRFTGMQLKDKHRATFGERRTSGTGGRRTPGTPERRDSFDSPERRRSLH